MNKKVINNLHRTDDRQGERTTILVSISEKGGMGKTIVGLTAAEQLTAANQSFFLVDSDVSTPNVGLTYAPEMYQGFKSAAGGRTSTPTLSRKDKGNESDKLTLQEQIVFTGNPDNYFHADKIFELAKIQDVLIVLPSQVATHINYWLEQNDAVEMLQDPDNTIDIVFLFITNGTRESLDLFVESVERFEGKIPHVLVKNLGAPTDIRWERGDFDPDGKVQEVLDKYGFKSIFFPEMVVAPEDKNKILSEYIPFGSALSDNWMSDPSKRRLNKWLREATQALGSTGYIPYHPSYVPQLPLATAADGTENGETAAEPTTTESTHS
jgi:hypothetical protein